METPFKRIGSVTFSYDGELGLSKEQTAKIKQIVVEPFHDMERPASSVSLLLETVNRCEMTTNLNNDQPFALAGIACQ